MDVEELLNYKPSRSIEDSEIGNKIKKSRIDETDKTTGKRFAPLEESTLKKMLLIFERKVLKNQELRIKFTDSGQKFMGSELELFDIIQELSVISTQPELYRFIVELNIVPTFLSLLSHDNVDISCAVVSLLQELTEVDDESELETITILLDALIAGSLIAQLVTNMERLDENVKEESEGVYNSLAIIENMLDYKPQLSSNCQMLINWILKRLKEKLPFDGNKLYACEILSILLQHSNENRNYLGTSDGIDSLLQQIAYYKRHNPASGDEQEYMENLFDCLCSSLLFCPKNRELFYKGEGIELMNLIIKEKRDKGSHSSVKMGALKVLNHVLSTEKGCDENLKACCNKFVEILGLRVLFPVFLKPKMIVSGYKKKEAKDAIDDVEEHCLSILLILLKNCKQENKKRIVNKFAEADFEKTERLLEAHFKYAERLIKCDALIQKENAKKTVNDEEIDEESLFMKRLTDGGLFTLQIIDYIILLISSFPDDGKSLKSSQASGSSSSSGVTNSTSGMKETLKERIIKLINMRSASSVNHYKFIKSILNSFTEDMTDIEESKNIIELIHEF